jgi:hypothetical protein
MGKGKSLIQSVVSDGFTPTSILVLKIVDRHPENRASTREWSGSRATVR